MYAQSGIPLPSSVLWNFLLPSRYEDWSREDISKETNQSLQFEIYRLGMVVGIPLRGKEELVDQILNFIETKEIGHKAGSSNIIRNGKKRSERAKC